MDIKVAKKNTGYGRPKAGSSNDSKLIEQLTRTIDLLAQQLAKK